MNVEGLEWEWGRGRVRGGQCRVTLFFFFNHVCTFSLDAVYCDGDYEGWCGLLYTRVVPVVSAAVSAVRWVPVAGSE